MGRELSSRFRKLLKSAVEEGRLVMAGWGEMLRNEAVWADERHTEEGRCGRVSRLVGMLGREVLKPRDTWAGGLVRSRSRSKKEKGAPEEEEVVEDEDCGGGGTGSLGE